MKFEEFEIIIKKNGEIIVRINGLGEKRIRHYRQIFEEAIGPIREGLEVSSDTTPPGAVRLAETVRTEAQQKSTKKLQH